MAAWPGTKYWSKCQIWMFSVALPSVLISFVLTTQFHNKCIWPLRRGVFQIESINFALTSAFHLQQVKCGWHSRVDYHAAPRLYITCWSSIQLTMYTACVKIGFNRKKIVLIANSSIVRFLKEQKYELYKRDIKHKRSVRIRVQKEANSVIIHTGI